MIAIVIGVVNIFKSNLKYNPKNRLLLLFPLYFIVLCLSLLYTENLEDGFKLIQRSLSLLLFPVIFLFLKEDASSVRKLFNFLLYGLILSFLINFIIVLTDAFTVLQSLPDQVSLWKKVTIGWQFFMHRQFSSLVNPGYISLYIILVLSFYLKKELNSLSRLATVLILFLYLFLLASKAAYITMFLMSFMLIYKVPDITKKYLLYVVFALGSIVFISNPRLFNSKYNFPQNVYETNPTISWNARLLTWTSAVNTIEKQPFIGYGVGDAHDALVNTYLDLGNSENYEHRYNAHNQFLETWLQTGAVGVLILTVIFTFLALSTRRSFNEFSVFLALFLALMFESMLVRFNGVVFFSIIVPLLLKERSILSSQIIRNVT